ncbi:MAG: PTS sugar transporter subunit IIA [Stygiobacter sp. RIFOXYC12_FULL_38_8]|nr:MAG: PTS sugar transporter subunit IIA [Stygiobacter sp. GWC2_38_9]OGV07503.1 MAG: PTS sugar transporter subunit IIA [Stygiobacter sp. RIFOXYB2_FULL_37_11]OGV11915.1 MAG: PTS sugar transporter subunit IIA [Stygiobacter sp. RIFOXYA2_FULL_38_8]OGV13764.1 MAG: PTS sugar transporter subunit IIA [Stygiobacter sp. RIFOXYC2_FULL_38_25]OGV23368.1 MAG: PTS sugar transporter subunit IIA [Stygiobacter sp. RIFOXYC12_FULL_38_8]OGV80148.1 MAG: PTS sugar transporter subunit IIA [Stygiobacter sp. GWF2_38_2
MKICEILKIEMIIPSMKCTTKEEAISELIDLFKNDDRVKDTESILNSVLEREKIMSTGVGKGFAIPHAKTNSVNEIIAAFGKIDNPIDFQALDDQPVNLVFLLVGKENLVGPHIKLLSRISRMMNIEEFRESLANATTAQEIYDLFETEEKQYFEGS